MLLKNQTFISLPSPNLMGIYQKTYTANPEIDEIGTQR